VSTAQPALEVFRASRLGLGGIVQLWCRGPGLHAALGPHLAGPAGAPRTLPGDGELRYGFIRRGGDLIDEVVIAGTRGGLEINCHGGTAAAKAILQLLCEQGAREVDALTWWRGEVRALRTSLPEAEAQIRLGEATALLPCRILAAGLRLAKELDELRALAPDGAAEARERLQRLVTSAPGAIAARTRRTVALVGRPNTGKSTLFNALLVRDRSLVSEVAGTTRDAVRHPLHPAGLDLDLVDTAGFFAAGGGVDGAAVARARDWARRADLRVLLLDGATPPTEEDSAAWAICREGPTLAIASRTDLPAPPVWEAERARHGLPRPALAVSARQEASVDGLERQIAEALGTAYGFGGALPPAPLPEAMVITGRQEGRLREALEALETGRTGEAEEALARAAGAHGLGEALAAFEREWQREQDDPPPMA
jgi:tRNA modification GTPase